MGSMMTVNMMNIPRDDIAEMVKDYAVLARSQADTPEGSVLARQYQVKSNRLRDMMDAQRAPADDQGQPYKPAKEMRAADWAASLPSSGLSASDLLAIHESQPPVPSGDLAFGRLKELETFERRYMLLHHAVAGDKLTISIDHGDYTQYIDSGAELDSSLDNPKSVLRGVQS
jgi:hypothetical protein